jgi:glycerol-3-phosphate dehydrogenase (NAD(P)+)
MEKQMGKAFWSESTVAVIGGGSFGTVLANAIATNSAQVRMYVRDDDQARAINATRANPNYVKDLTLDPRVKAVSDFSRLFEVPLDAVVFALPARVTREEAKGVAARLQGTEILFHATKGIEEGTLKRMSVVLGEELPVSRIGVISGPNLATEMARGDPAATVVASRFDEVIRAGRALLSGPKLRVYGSQDVVGVEWAGTLKNIFAIAAGILDAKGLGWNTRAFLISRGLAEMVRFAAAMGAEIDTFLGPAGVGDLIATCSSPQSRNYRVGAGLATGKPLQEVLDELGQVAEGVRTTEIIFPFAESRGVEMPITEAVFRILKGEWSVEEGISNLMTRPIVEDSRFT